MVAVMKTEAIRGEWVGRVIDGRYPLLEWLGGSMSSGVFLTEIREDQPMKAAIRLTRVDDSKADGQVARWTEAALLSHPHLIRLFHTGRCQIDGERLVYAVMEYAEENLAQILPERPLTSAEAGEMLEPVLDALGYLHAKGLVHAHLKPANILVVNDQVKLSIESVQAAGRLGMETRELGVYDAPECSTRVIGPASDVWSLGITLVEALTQRPPAWERTAQNDPAVPEKVPEPFARIVMESLHVDPARRASIADIRTRLKGNGSAEILPAKTDGARTGTNRRAVIVAAAVVVIAVFAIILIPKHHSDPTTAGEAPQATVGEPAQSTAPAPTPAPAPAPAARRDNGAVLKGDVAERAEPDLLPKAVASIHGGFNVVVRVKVDAAGAVSDATLDSEGPSRYFAKAAVEAARRWRFKPAQVKGEAVPSEWLLHFRFTRGGSEITPVEVAP